MKRASGAFGLLELVFLALLISCLAIAALSLASRTQAEAHDLADRVIAQGLCLDALERARRYKPIWGLPGEPARDGRPAGPPLSEAFLPVEIRPGQATAFDAAYVQKARALGVDLAPKIERRPAAGAPGLFQLTVTLPWKDADGRRREVSYSRFCFAP